MSSNDVLDVLNVRRGLYEPVKKKKKVEISKKQLGINRELYNLLGENTPAIQLSNASKFKSRIASKSKPAPWRWAKFKNSARSDGLELNHWVRGSTESVGGYAFEQYNQKLKLPKFDEATYDRLVKGVDDGIDGNTWTYGETRYLFDMCVLYDLRWLIIYDRYDYTSGINELNEANEANEMNKQNKVKRSLGDLKERFYFICKLIITDENKILKEAGILDENKNKLVAALSFDKQKEEERKKYLERLLARSPAEIAEEESLIIEARRFEQAAQKMLSERASLLHLLDSPSSTGNINQYLTSQGLSQLYNALMFSDKTKKRNKLDANPSAVASPVSSSAPVLTVDSKKKKQSDDPVAQLLLKKLSPEEEAAYGLSYHSEKLQTGVHLRSSKINTYKPAVQNKVNAVLNELGISNRPVIVTEKIVEKFNSLTESIATLLETKKQIDKLETEATLINKSL